MLSSWDTLGPLHCDNSQHHDSLNGTEGPCGCDGIQPLRGLCRLKTDVHIGAEPVRGCLPPLSPQVPIQTVVAVHISLDVCPGNPMCQPGQGL